ncbi:MAG: hypothetical protein ACREX8_04195 [Gammaproteobacteria bacterium]
MRVGYYAKAIVAFLVTTLTALSGYMDDGMVVRAEWESIGALLLASLSVLLLPNAPKPPDVTPAGHSAIPPSKA